MQCDTCFWFKRGMSCACFDFKGKTAETEIKCVQDGILPCAFYLEGEHDRYILHNGTKYQVNMERPKSSKKQVLELTLHNPYSTKQFDTTEKLKNYVREQALEV